MSINKDLANATQEQEFTEVVNIIVQHKNKASRTQRTISTLCMVCWWLCFKETEKRGMGK